jgi:hypothetical protein
LRYEKGGQGWSDVQAGARGGKKYKLISLSYGTIGNFVKCRSKVYSWCLRLGETQQDPIFKTFRIAVANRSKDALDMIKELFQLRWVGRELMMITQHSQIWKH